MLEMAKVDSISGRVAISVESRQSQVVRAIRSASRKDAKTQRGGGREIPENKTGREVVHADAAIQTHLRLADKKLGFLPNFGAALMKDGIVRAVNGLEES